MSIARRNETAFALIVAALFLAAAGFIAAHHEIWRDEAQAFLIAKESRSLDDLALRLRFDGHPALWYWVLFVLTRFTHAPEAMQIVHLLIAAAAVFLFARLAPFPRVVRLLFAFSYFPLYEYGVISRNYALGMLLLFAFCAVFPRRHRSLLAPAAVLVLMAQVHLHMIILAGVLAFLLAAERWVRRRGPRPRFQSAGAAFVLISLALGVYQVAPVGDSVFAKPVRIAYEPGMAGVVVRSMAKAFVAVPDPQLNFWGKSILNRFSWTAVAAPALAILFVLFAVLGLLDRPVVLGFYVLATLALLGFFYTAYLGFMRHHGNLFLVFLAALWMADLPDPEPSRPGRFASIAAIARRLAPAVLGGLLAVQVAATAVAASYDIRYPFSQARRTAAFIRLQGLSDRVLVGDTHLKLAAISAYLDRPIYYPYLERWGAYSLFIHGVHDPMSMTPIVAAAERLSRETGRDYLIVLSYPLDEASLATRGLRPVAGFGSPIVEDEEFYLYRKERRDSILLRRAEDSGIMPGRGARP